MFNPLRALPLRFGSPKPPLPLRATAFYSMNSDCLGPLAAPAFRFRFRLSSQLALRFSLVSLYRFQGSHATSKSSIFRPRRVDFWGVPSFNASVIISNSEALVKHFLSEQGSVNWAYGPFSPQYVVFSRKNARIWRRDRKISLLRYGFSHFDERGNRHRRRAQPACGEGARDEAINERGELR